jgi:HPt (histidine-containing phosphotransfer) domain-containing protein
MTSEPGEPKSGASPPLDLAVLAAYVGDDAEVMQEFTERFIPSARKALADFVEGGAKEDGQAIADTAHRFKSVASYLGAAPLVELCKRFETAGRAGDLAAVRALLPVFETAVDDASAYLSSQL